MDYKAVYERWLAMIEANWNTYRYVGLSLLEAVWYMFCYTVNGIKKYRTINRHRAD